MRGGGEKARDKCGDTETAHRQRESQRERVRVYGKAETLVNPEGEGWEGSRKIQR